jgi:group I intron endonuclease
MYHIYKFTNLINNKSYIGRTNNFEKRVNQHLFESYYKKSQTYNTTFHRAVRKYGIHNFTQQIIYQTLCEQHSKEAEEHFIREYNTHCRFGYGYNMTYGGEGTKGVFRSPKVRKNMSDAQLNKKKTPQTLKRLHESMLCYGDKISKEWEIITPNGEKFTIKNLNKFCRENNLNQANMIKVANGTSKYCKNFICSRKF